MEPLSLDLSIVMPVFNEAPVIADVIKELDRDIALRVPSAEIVVVNDASDDGTKEILDHLAKANPRLRVQHSTVNRGHGPTMRRAIELSKGKWIFHIDSDKQFVGSDFWKLWECRDRADLILGVRVRRHDPLHRRILTRIVRLAVRVMASKKIRDPNIPFKLFSRDLWEGLRRHIAESALAPSIMISMGAVLRGDEVVEVPVAHLPREHGRSSLRLWRLAQFCTRGFSEILDFRMLMRRATAPACK